MIALRGHKTLQHWGCRSFSLTSTVWSGHNRWSKIKHDKAKEDAWVTKQRSAIAEELRQASRDNGPDPQMNPRLAALVTVAKKQGFPKTSIENAITRGQGLSPNGAALEPLTIEAIVPPSVAVIIECQTESKLRTLSDIRILVKSAGGNVTPTNHLFDKKGKIVFGNPQGLTEEDIFDQAIEAGATDIEVGEDGNIEVFTAPNQTMAAAKDLSNALDLKVKSSDIVWSPKEEMMVNVDEPEALNTLLGRLQDDASVQGVYVNAI